jgi:hypothetical protein
MNRVVTTAILVSFAAACDDPFPLGEVKPAPGSVTVLDTVGPDGKTGWWPSIAFDANDTPHLSYCDAYHADLRYATRVGTQWRVESVVSDGKVGKYTAIAVDSKGHPAIAFYDQDTKYLRLARETDHGWTDERVAWGLEVGMGSELRFDANDEPHLFYYIPSGKLIHGRRASDGSWTKQVVAEVTGGFTVRINPVLRPDGSFWVTFVDWNFRDTTLYLARQTANGFQTEVVADRRGPGWRSQVWIQNGEPTVVYSQSFSQSLHLAQKRDQEWRAQTLLPNAVNFSASQAPDGTLVVAYEDVERGQSGQGTVKYMRCRTDGCDRYDVDVEGSPGGYIAVATDSKGKPLIAYFARAIRGIKVYDETIAGQPTVIEP